jgi:hypothetical protein
MNEKQILSHLNANHTWTSNNNAAIRYCSAKGYKECVEQILQHGGDVSVDNYSPVHTIKDILVKERALDKDKYSSYIYILALLLLYIENVSLFEFALGDLETFSLSNQLVQTVYEEVLENMLDIISSLPPSQIQNKASKELLLKDKNKHILRARRVQQNIALGADFYRDSPPSVSFL